MNPNSIVTFEDVAFAYNGATVLDGVSFTVGDGESLCLIGPNGGGKTTLLKLMLGLLKPDRGRIEILGSPPVKARSRIGYTPQHFDFDPKFPVTALDIVLMGRLDRLRGGRYRAGDREAALAALDRVTLAGAADKSYARLSGGQRQRVLIARALVCEPRILLLDEPTANIDLTVEAQLLDSIEKLKEDMSILTVTHDLGVVNHFGDRVLCVNHSVHSHAVSELDGHVIREIFSDELRHEHERHALHGSGDHSKCDHG